MDNFLIHAKHNRQRQGVLRSSSILLSGNRWQQALHACDFTKALIMMADKIKSQSAGEQGLTYFLFNIRKDNIFIVIGHWLPIWSEQWRNCCMLQQVVLHSREFPDVHRLQTLVTRGESVKCVKMAQPMCGAVITGAGFVVLTNSWLKREAILC